MPDPLTQPIPVVADDQPSSSCLQWRASSGLTGFAGCSSGASGSPAAPPPAASFVAAQPSATGCSAMTIDLGPAGSAKVDEVAEQ